MGREEGRGLEDLAARVAGAADKAEFGGQSRVCGLAAYCSGGSKGRIAPDLFTDRRVIFMSAQAAFAGVLRFLVNVLMVGEVELGQRAGDLAAMQLDEFGSAQAAGIHAAFQIVVIKAGRVVADQILILGIIRADKVAFFFA